MTRKGYDGITPSRLPADGDVYFSYVDGHWPNFRELPALFPGKVYVSICVDPAHDAQVLDCEAGDATPAQTLPWVLRQRAAGRIPTVYCSESVVPTVYRIFDAARVVRPQIWYANYDWDRSLKPGYVAKQYGNTAGYDISTVLDFVPGWDVPVPPPPPPPPPVEDELMPSIAHLTIDKSTVPAGTDWPGEYVLFLNSGIYMHIAPSEGLTSNVHAFVMMGAESTSTEITYAQHLALMAAAPAAVVSA